PGTGSPRHQSGEGAVSQRLGAMPLSSIFAAPQGLSRQNAASDHKITALAALLPWTDGRRVAASNLAAAVMPHAAARETPPAGIDACIGTHGPVREHRAGQPPIMGRNVAGPKLGR